MPAFPANVPVKLTAVLIAATKPLAGPVITAVGMAFTVSVPDPEAVHPLASVAVTP